MCHYLSILLLESDEAKHYRLDTMNAVLNLIEGKFFEIALQPIVDVNSEAAIGCEALTRVSIPPHQGPDLWFSHAQFCGLRKDLEVATIQSALKLLPSLAPAQFLSLNISPSTVIAGGLVQSLSGAPLERIVLELTEHSVVGGYEPLNEALSSWRSKGLRLAIDDAGAGHSSFRHILELKPDIVKIDRSFISGINRLPDNQALIVAMVSFARKIGCKLIAEGVETRQEANVLKSIGVNYQQGYFHGRPTVPSAPALAASPLELSVIN